MSATYYDAPDGVVGQEPSNGVGDDAKQVQRLFYYFKSKLLESISLGDVQKANVGKLYSVFEECSQQNWDGYSGLPVSYESFLKAKQFIEDFPLSLPAPEISVDPDGEITFEWYRAPRKVFSVSIGPNNRLSYAGLFGASKTYGTETFHDGIPRVVLDNVQRLAL
jgi:hypothetical protein